MHGEDQFHFHNVTLIKLSTLAKDFGHQCVKRINESPFPTETLIVPSLVSISSKVFEKISNVVSVFSQFY